MWDCVNDRNNFFNVLSEKIMDTALLEWISPMLIGAVAFFLHQLVTSVKDMAKDVGEIKVTIASHAEKVEEIGKRIDKLEDWRHTSSHKASQL